MCIADQNLHMDVYGSFIHNYQNLEATKLPFSRWINKLWYIHKMELYSMLKRNDQAMKNNGGVLNAYYWVKETNLKGYILHDSDYMAFCSLIAQLVKNPPAIQETRARSLGGKDPLEKKWATHCSILGLPLWLSW